MRVQDVNDKIAERRHRRIWKFLRTFVGPFFLKKYGCECKDSGVLPEPFILLANHNSNMDPAFIGMSCRQQMYFVSSEHLFRMGFISKLVLWAFRPIAKIKGSSDKLTVMQMMRTLRNGKNIALFPDGNRSFNGKNSPMTDAIGKLVRASGANLVTFRITGGFFTTPRWGFGIRKGKMTAGVQGVYTSDSLKDMQPSQIREIIENDLAEDAYARQKTEHIRYKGKNMAEGIECSLCTCPKCHRIDAIYSKGNSVFCKECGRLTDYSEYGYFDDGFTFHTIEEWDAWQEPFVKGYFAGKAEGEVFRDEDVRLQTVNADHRETSLGHGTFSLTKESILFTTKDSTLEIKLSDIPDMSVYSKTGLVFTDNTGTHYELKTDRIINVRKYIFAWEAKNSEET